MAAFRAGFDMHLAKPIDPMELIAIMARLVTNHRAWPPDELTA